MIPSETRRHNSTCILLTFISIDRLANHIYKYTYILDFINSKGRRMDYAILDIYAEKLKAIGHPVRLKLVMGLMGNECNVTKICKGLDIPQATTSQHLAILKNKGIIKGRRDGTSICYSVEDEAIKKMLKVLMEETECDFGECRQED